MEEHGRLTLPTDYVARSGLGAGTRLVFEPIEDGLALRFARPDARRAYIEVTARCNLNCAMCVRQVWRDTPDKMSWETFQAVIEGLRAFADPSSPSGQSLRRVTFGGFGEPLAHPRFPDMLTLAAELEVGLTLATNGLLLDETMVGLEFGRVCPLPGQGAGDALPVVRGLWHGLHLRRGQRGLLGQRALVRRLLVCARHREMPMTGKTTCGILMAIHLCSSDAGQLAQLRDCRPENA